MATIRLKDRKDGETLDTYLNERVFSGQNGSTELPHPVGTAGFLSFMERYRSALPAEKAAAEALN